MKPGKLLFTIAFLSILQVPVMAVAETAKEAELTMTVPETDTDTDTKIGDVLPELILRPIGILSSAAGLGFFIASLPFVAVASIPEPHNAIDFTYETFIQTPFRFTFLRPIGTYNVPIENKVGIAD